MRFFRSNKMVCHFQNAVAITNSICKNVAAVCVLSLEVVTAGSLLSNIPKLGQLINDPSIHAFDSAFAVIGAGAVLYGCAKLLWGPLAPNVVSLAIQPPPPTKEELKAGFLRLVSALKTKFQKCNF